MQRLLVVAIAMWRLGTNAASRQLIRVAIVIALGALTAACFQPLYGDKTLSADDSVRDKLTAVDIEDIKAANGTLEARIAVALRNQLLFDLNGGGDPVAPTYRLTIGLQASRTTVIVDVSSGRPETQVEGVNVSLSLKEIATNKVVLTTSTFARASFDIPGSAQRFAAARAARNAEDRAVAVIAENIRNRLASYFVAGT
jgi:LPS-assembly lipoprotein